MAAKPTLVLLPGHLCDRSVWEAQERALSRDYTVLTVRDFYGYDSLAGMARAVLARMPPRFALAGHSMGARVALAMMSASPERVERLALWDTGATPAVPGEAEKRQEMIELAFSRGMGALAQRWLPPMVHPDRLADAAFMDGLTAMICRATPEIYAAQARALLGRPDFRPLLPQIACPTLVACARQDAWSPPAQHEAIAAAIPGARLAFVEDSGHMVTVERPEAVTALLFEWMRA
jgi:pimeloyl-ACP methyl ester carboxylesterase